MKVYNEQRSYYCGIDLHARTMYVCILDGNGKKVLHKDIPCIPIRFLQLIDPFRKDLVVGFECIFCWYWLADLCEQEGIDFVLGHALYMRAIHGVKTKNDRLDSLKIARLMRGGNFPVAYVYPAQMRPTRDLMRRRNHFVRKRAELLAHIQNTTSQYNLEPLGSLSRSDRRRDKDIPGDFPDPVVQQIVETYLKLIDHYDPIIKELDKKTLFLARNHDQTSLHLLQSIKGVGDVLSMTMLYEIGNINVSLLRTTQRGKTEGKKVMNCVRGVVTPPCGVPFRLGIILPSSLIGVLSHSLISRSILPSLTRPATAAISLYL